MSQNWKTNFQSAFKTVDELYSFLGWEDVVASGVAKKYPLFVPRKLAEKIKQQGPEGVLARQFLPHADELSAQGLVDPIGDKTYNKAPQLIHRYHSRALFTPTTICPVHCRYCFRKNELNTQDELFAADFAQTLSYLRSHPEISEIIFTGGDPLTLSNEKLSTYLAAFAEIDSIKDIRFHSRYPVILPERLDAGFKSLIQEFSSRFRTITLAIHANHVSEFDPENMAAIKELSALPLQLLSQTVLLKGVNDEAQSLLELMDLFLTLKVRPYYLHHPDQVRGGLHFYLPLETGRRLYAQLRSQLPGWALPLYVIDIPGGPGKVGAFNPEEFAFSGQLIGLEGTQNSVQEPDFFSF